MSAKIDLAGKRIVVTGSSMGIGQAVAIRLAREGARLVINARHPAALETTLNTIKQQGGSVIVSCGSVADFNYAGEVIQTCVDQYGGIDVLINCAGIIEPQGSSILNISSDDWQQLIAVHLTGSFNTCRHAAPVMAAQKNGTIINTGSHAFLGMYGGTGYAAGKGGTVSLTMALAMDLKEYGINVNAVCPGAKTRMSSGDEYEALIHQLNKRGLLSDDLMENSLHPPSPDHVAALYAYLASDAAKPITGRIFWGAGGYVGQFHRNADQLWAMRDHEIHAPWSLQELHQKLGVRALQTPDALFNVILGTPGLKVAVKQALLLKLANARWVKAWQTRARKRASKKQTNLA